MRRFWPTLYLAFVSLAAAILSKSSPAAAAAAVHLRPPRGAAAAADENNHGERHQLPPLNELSNKEEIEKYGQEMSRTAEDLSHGMDPNNPFQVEKSMFPSRGTQPDDNKTLCFSLISSPIDEATDEPPFIHDLRFVLEGIVLAVIANGGIGGNLLSMFILLKKKLDLQPFLCRLLVLLVVFDTIFLVADLFIYGLPLLSNSYDHFLNPLLAPKFLIPLSQIALTGSVYTIVAITVERYISCCWPHVPPREGRIMTAFSIIGLVLFSVIYNISRFFEYTTVQHVLTEEENCTIFQSILSIDEKVVVKDEWMRLAQEDQPFEIINTALRDNANYIRYYLLAANCTVMVFIPLVSLIILNWQIYKAIKNREKFRATLTTASSFAQRPKSAESDEANIHNREREVTISQILIAIVAMFFICQSFKVIVVGYEVITYMYGVPRSAGFPIWVEVVICLNHVALAFNAAINIAIYICKDKKFRTACLELMPCFRAAAASQQQLHNQPCSNSTESTQTNGSHAAAAVANLNRPKCLSPRRDIVVDLEERQQQRVMSVMAAASVTHDPNNDLDEKAGLLPPQPNKPRDEDKSSVQSL